jgi:hypothetical protein
MVSHIYEAKAYYMIALLSTCRKFISAHIPQDENALQELNLHTPTYAYSQYTYM